MNTDERPPLPMRYRKLRIAWSVACGVLAILLCVLWVRSYFVCDYMVRRGGLVVTTATGASTATTTVALNRGSLHVVDASGTA